MKRILKILEKIGLLKKRYPDPDKAGWPGLKVLPKVDNLIDVGIGHQGSEGFYKYFTNSRKFFIDPLIETKSVLAQHLKNSENKYYECAVSDKEGVMEFKVHQPISRSSFHVLENESLKLLEVRNVKVKTLDNLFSKVNSEESWGIKIDVEGHEMQTLLGGEELIKKCSFVIVEVEIRKKFKNSAKFGDIVNWMLRRKFEVVAIRVSGDGTDHVDLAFAKEGIIGE